MAFDQCILWMPICAPNFSRAPVLTQSPSAGSESGKSDTSSAKRKWKAMIASLPPLLPTQQQVMQQLLETDSRELRKQRVIDPDAVYSKLWDVLVLIILLFNAAMIPYRIAFLPPTRGLFDAHYAVAARRDLTVVEAGVVVRLVAVIARFVALRIRPEVDAHKPVAASRREA